MVALADDSPAAWNPQHPQVATLPSGLRVIFMRIAGAVAIGASLGVDVGSADEPDEWAGISHFLEHLVFRGTQAFESSESVGKAIEAVGGDFNAFTGKSYTQYICAAPLAHRNLVLQIPSELVIRPLFRQADLEDERPVVLREIGLEEDNAGRRMTRALETIMWPNSPMARPIIGRPETLAEIRAADVQAYWSGHYQPHKATFAVAGDLEFTEVLDLVEKATANWPASTTPARPATAPAAVRANRVLTEHMPDRKETVFALASSVGPWKSIDLPVTSVLATIAGDGEGSWIARDLVRRRGLLLSGGALAWLNRDAGAIGFSGTVRPTGVQRGIASLLKLADGLKNPPSPEDFKRAVGYVRGDILRQWLRPLDVAVQLCQQALLGDERIGPLHDLEALATVRPEQVMALAKELFEPSRLRLAVAGPIDPGVKLDDLLSIGKTAE